MNLLEVKYSKLHFVPRFNERYCTIHLSLNICVCMYVCIRFYRKRCLFDPAVITNLPGGLEGEGGIRGGKDWGLFFVLA